MMWTRSGRWKLFLALLFLVVQWPRRIATAGSCPLTQFRCSTGTCINLNVFCDGRNDCGDNSDEPPLCTHCNRTYYAEMGESYRLLVTWPKSNNLPFVCYLTFTSVTHDPAEILQVRLDTMAIGHYAIQSAERCPDGSLQIWEGDQPLLPPSRLPGGAWCGASIFPRFFYTESNAVTFVLRLLNIPPSVLSKPDSSPPVMDLTYKVLSRSSSIVRYGLANDSVHLGEQMPGTLCSRSFRVCDQRTCRIQSPGYPGLYPRNAHCLYRITQQVSQTAGRKLVIGLSQPDGRKINLRDWEQRDRLRSGSDCETAGDYVTVYDGPSTTSAILARFCGSGPLPEIVSSGSEVVVEFRTSVFDTVYSAATSIEGFELIVRIISINVTVSAGAGASFDATRCQFNVTSTGLSKGILDNVEQTWPASTTCHFRFHGRFDERVWIYFLKYHLAPGPVKSSRRPSDSQCRNSLKIIDGDESDNKTLGLFCRDRPPPLCERRLTLQVNQSRQTTPCLKGQSFTSSSSTLTLEQQLDDGTAFQPWRYALAYEFFRDVLDGLPFNRSRDSSSHCHRLFTSQMDSRGHVRSPQNVFLFGRGGAKNLRCVYRFQGDEDARVGIEISRLRLGGRPCSSQIDGDTHRRLCKSQDPRLAAAFLLFQERPWRSSSVVLIRDCICDTNLLPFRYISGSNVVELVFQVDEMSYGDDYHDFFFEINYEFLPGVKCTQHARLQGPGGLLTLEGSRASSAAAAAGCNRQRWLWEPRPDRFLFLSTNGFSLSGQSNASKSNTPCTSNNRILVYWGGDGHPQNVICPTLRSHQETLRLFSETRDTSPISSDGAPLHGLATERDESLDDPLDRWPFMAPKAAPNTSIVIEFIATQSGSYSLKWLELTPQAVVNPAGSVIPLGSISPTWSVPFLCPTWCPELQACVDLALWCNGVYDCPSGLDESDLSCSHQRWNFPKVYWYLVAAGTTFFVLFVMVSSVIVCRGRRFEATSTLESSNTSSLRSSCGRRPSGNDPAASAVLGRATAVGTLETGLYDKKLAVS